MRVPCTYGCGAEFDDEYRSTLCPHDTFAATWGGVVHAAKYPCHAEGRALPEDLTPDRPDPKADRTLARAARQLWRWLFG